MMTGAAAVLAIGVMLLSAGCRREAAAQLIARVEAGHLPEDPRAGRQSESQWRAHMAEEERERQLGYDRRRLAQHRAVIRLLNAARARYDRATAKASVDRARSRMPALIQDLRSRFKAIDHWGVNSPLLGDYDALIAQLAGPYPEARVAALQGDPRALEDLRADADRRIKRATEWLAEAANSEDE